MKNGTMFTDLDKYKKQEFFDEHPVALLLTPDKNYTRDVIDTLGQRLKEVVIPIPNSEELKKAISEKARTIGNNRIQARDIIQSLSDRIIL